MFFLCLDRRTWREGSHEFGCLCPSACGDVFWNWPHCFFLKLSMLCAYVFLGRNINLTGNINLSFDPCKMVISNHNVENCLLTLAFLKSGAVSLCFCYSSLKITSYNSCHSKLSLFIIVLVNVLVLCVDLLSTYQLFALK